MIREGDSIMSCSGDWRDGGYWRVRSAKRERLEEVRR